MSQTEIFEPERINSINKKLSSPQGYTGLSAFHKYWGKKPIECLSFVISHFSKQGQIVLDPFLGSGLIAREALRQGRRFIGIDINPFSIELTKLLVGLPSAKEYSKALYSIENSIRSEIESSYATEDNSIATHFLWKENKIQAVWRIKKGTRKREELDPTLHDLELFNRYKNFTSQQIRPLKFFQNSRINATEKMTLNDLFTGRALRNIDLIINSINKQPSHIRAALRLTLTSAVGQMSRMVFAITGRGKNNGNASDRIEVGSWVIGFWRPKLHFEVNVWNCFFNRAKKFLKTLLTTESFKEIPFFLEPNRLLQNEAGISLVNQDARVVLNSLPNNSINLILTDPPHSDRIPYLELSELWNAILGRSVDFDNEIVVSDANDRQKNRVTYIKEMTEFFFAASKTLTPGGILAIIFNARDEESWRYFRNIEDHQLNIKFLGCFPMQYSAASVVQDNRKGALRHDYVLVYGKNVDTSSREFQNTVIGIKDWSTMFPNFD